jgi:hypothetical protein
VAAGQAVFVLKVYISVSAVTATCGSGLAREGGVLGDVFFTGVHIRCCGNGGYRFRSYSQPFQGLRLNSPQNSSQGDENDVGRSSSAV